MNASSPLIDAVLTELIWLLGAGVLGIVVTAAALVLGSARKRVPPVIGAAGVGLVALAAIGGGLGGLYNPDVYTGALAAGLIHLLAGFTAFPMAGLLLLGTAVLAFRDPPWRRGVPGVVAGLVALTVVFTVVEGWMGMNLRFGLVRGAVVLGLGVLTVASTISDAEDARDGAATAGVAFALAVAVIESAERGMAAALGLVQTVNVVDYEIRGKAIERMLAYVAPGVPFGFAATGAAIAVGLVTLGATMRSRGARAGDAAALLWLALAPAVLFVGMPDAPELTAAAAAGPPPKARTP